MKTTQQESNLVELVGIYPEESEKNNLLATFHFFLIREKLDVRGGKIVKMKNNKIFIQLPQSRGFDPDLKKLVYFPVLTFLDADYQKAMREEVIQKVMMEWKKLTSKRPKKKTARQS